MPTKPRIARGVPRGSVTTFDGDPRECLAVIHWHGRPRDADELLPAYRLGEATLDGVVTAVRVRWWWATSNRTGTWQEDWLDPGDVLDRQPTAEEWEALVGRGVLG